MHECPSHTAIEHSARIIAGCDSRTLTKCGKTLSRLRMSYQAGNGDFMRPQDWQGKNGGALQFLQSSPRVLGHEDCRSSAQKVLPATGNCNKTLLRDGNRGRRGFCHGLAHAQLIHRVEHGKRSAIPRLKRDC